MTNPIAILKSLLFEYKERLELADEAPVETKEDEIKVSEMVIGGKVEMVDAEGKLAPAEDGQYTIGEDVIDVKDGQIVAINGDKGEEAPKEEEVEAAAEEAVEEAPKEDEKPNEEIEAMKAEIEALKEAVAALIADKEGFKSEIENTVGEFNKTLLTITEMPAEFSKTTEKNVVKDSKQIKMNEFASILSNIRKK